MKKFTHDDFKNLIKEELQFFMNEMKQRRLYKDESGAWLIDAEVGTHPIKNFGFKLGPDDTVDVYFLRTAHQGDSGIDVNDYCVYFPTANAAWEKIKEVKSGNPLTVAQKRIKLEQLKVNNRGRKVSLVSLKRGVPAPGKLLKVLEIPKELAERAATSYEEVAIEDFLKGQGANSILKHAFGAYFIAIKAGEEITFADWAARIKKSYDITNSATLMVYNAIKAIGNKAKIIKTGNGKHKGFIRGKRA